MRRLGEWQRFKRRLCLQKLAAYLAGFEARVDWLWLKILVTAQHSSNEVNRMNSATAFPGYFSRSYSTQNDRLNVVSRAR